MIGIVHNDYDKVLMKYEYESISFQPLRTNQIKMIYPKEVSRQDKVLITNDSYICNKFPSKYCVLIVYSIYQEIHTTFNIIMLQYSSNHIKEVIEEKYPELKNIKSVVMQVLPKQKIEIEPLETQDATIFYHGEDRPEDLVDVMFDLDTKTYYEVQFYNIHTREVPSKKHRLSWNVSLDENRKGIIIPKVINEIENGCLPILLKENAPEYFKNYPFLITLEEVNNKEKLIERVKEISHFISKMKRDTYASFANSIYNNIYIKTKWNYNYFTIAKEINRFLDK